MHVHVPKPLHGWKAFANEIVIIVIGVLIALGFEQVAEEVHWRHKVREGEEMLKEEALRNLGIAAEYYAVAACIDGQIDMVRQQLLRPPAAREPLPRYADKTERYVIRIPNRAVYMTTWQSLLGDGTLNHMPVQRFAQYSAFYQAIAKRDEMAQQDYELAKGLMVLANVPVMQGADGPRYLERVEMLDVNANTTRSIAIRAMLSYRDLRLPVPAERLDRYVADAATTHFCKTHGYPVEDWRKGFAEQLRPMVP